MNPQYMNQSPYGGGFAPPPQQGGFPGAPPQTAGQQAPMRPMFNGQGGNMPPQGANQPPGVGQPPGGFNLQENTRHLIRVMQKSDLAAKDSHQASNGRYPINDITMCN